MDCDVGHADLIETQKGDWWFVCLASRPYGGLYRNLGRETFLAPMTWEDDWPVMCPDTGRVELDVEHPNLKEHTWPSLSSFDSFESTELDVRWNYLRTPNELYYSLTDRPNHLRLYLSPQNTTEFSNPSMLCRRQEHINFSSSTVLDFVPSSMNETAGLLLIQNHDYQFRVELVMDDKEKAVRLVKRKNGDEVIIASKPYSHSVIYLKVEAFGQSYDFYYGEEPNKWLELKIEEDGRILSTDVAGGFTGTYLGLFASSNGFQSKNYADFDWFEYIELEC